MENEIRVAKRNYSGKLRNKLFSSDCACEKEWKTLPIIRHHPPALWRINNWQTIWMSSIAGLKKHHSHLQPPPPPHLRCKKIERRKAQAQTVWHHPVWKLVLTSWPQSSHRSSTDLQQITGAVRSPLMLQTVHHHPCFKETQNYRTKWLQTCGSNVCGQEIIWKTGFSLFEGHHIQNPLCLLTSRRLRSWLSGAVLTTWSLTCSKLWRWSWTSGENVFYMSQGCENAKPNIKRTENKTADIIFSLTSWGWRSTT